MQGGQKSSYRYLPNVWFCMCMPCTVINCGAWLHCHQYVYVHTICHGTLYMAHSMHIWVHVSIHVVVRGMVRSQSFCMLMNRILLECNLTHSASYVIYLAHNVFHITSFPTYRIYSRNSRTFLTKILCLNLGCMIYARKRFYVGL